MEEEQAQSLVTGRVKRYTEDSNATAEVFRSVFYHDQCLFMLLASQSDALIVPPHRDPSIQPTFSSEALKPIYMKDRKSFKNSDNAM